MYIFARLAYVLAGCMAVSVYAAEPAGNPASGKTKTAVCASCHGPQGNGGADPAWPKLAGQIPEYLVKQITEFQSGARKNPIMNGMAAALSKQDVKDIAAFYANQKIQPGVAATAELARQGEHMYRGGNAKTGVSACMSCHGPSGHGIPPRFPRVSGQSATYAEQQLLAFKSAARINDDEVMTRIAFRMSESEIKAVSEYMAGLR